jgi:leucyl aminopeptidase
MKTSRFLMKKMTWMIALVTSTVFAAPVKYITIGTDAVMNSQKNLKSVNIVKSQNDISVLKVSENELLHLSHIMHEDFKRCGGYMVHESEEEALEVLANSKKMNKLQQFAFTDFSITMGDVVKPMVEQVQEVEVRSTIEKLSSFKNRFYKSQNGVKSSQWIKEKWASLANKRTDVKVEEYTHANWPQKSIIMTIEGSELKDEVVVIGGHQDSIAGMFGGENAEAPGADDNASGIATVTETIRVAMAAGYKPKRTIKFMAYSAEEVGLLGSKEIAKKFADQKIKVVGKMQLDMTNHKGTSDLDIVMMSDYTNRELNEFLGKLIDEYVKVPWGYSRCGYGCSDHASWHNNGYPATMPFESTMEDINGKIHTRNDVIENSNSTADHAEKFARMAVAFMVEMGK